jgi:putative hydrolase of the HAD superfamily
MATEADQPARTSIRFPLGKSSCSPVAAGSTVLRGIAAPYHGWRETGRVRRLIRNSTGFNSGSPVKEQIVNHAIRAITFDLWDTIVDDDSDEPKRIAKGLLSKKAQRRRLILDALNAIEPIDEAAVNLAYDTADAAFNFVWHDQHVTWTIGQRLQVVLKGLGRSLPQDAFDRVVADHQAMEVDIEPDLIDGCAEALAELSTRYSLAIVSDAIVTPGFRLRDLLEKHGVKRYFSGFAFSDEVGRSKPHRDMFASAAEQLGVELRQMIHIGDRDHNDIQGPHALGIKAVLFTAARNLDQANTQADAICERYADLPGIIDRLAGERT